MHTIKQLSILLVLFLISHTGLQAQNEITVTDDRTGEEEVIGLPEGMTQDLDSLLQDWHTQNLLQTDDCNYQGGIPSFDDATYKERLRRMPTAIEMPYNAVVRKFIDQYSQRLRRSVSLMLGASNFYTPIFEEALEAYSLPLELKYLPIIESALNPRAVSRAGAVGLWQFMITTGKRYGLEVTSLVDDRMDPYKASYAAAHYLSDLYKIFGDWSLVIAAYNCGPGNITKAIHRAGGAKDYWVIYPYLPRETRGYVPAFIAANYIMNYYCEHHICPMQATLPQATDTVVVNTDIHFEQIADLCHLELDQVKALNPQYRRQIVPGRVRPSAICLPQTAVGTFIDQQDTIATHRADELLTRRDEVAVNEGTVRSNSRSSRSNKTVRVRSGQTLSEIAKRNGTTVARLRQINGIRGNNIRAGQRLKVR